MEKNKGLWLLLIYFLLAVYILPMFPQGGSASETTRWATAVSLVENTSFDIAWTQDLVGNNLESIKIAEKTYSVQPPGTAVLAAPVYAITRIFVGAPDASNMRISWFVMRFFVSSLPLLFLAFWLYGRDSDEFSLATLLFASPLFVSSLLFDSGILVGVLLYFAFRLIFDSKRIFLRYCFFAGLLSGFAILCEPFAAITVFVIGFGMLFAERSDQWRNILFFSAGIFPSILLLFLYNNSLFGMPFAFPQFSGGDGRGMVLLGIPTLSGLYHLLISPSRGLFFYAPLLLMSIAAVFTSRERGSLRQRVKIAAIVLSVAGLCGKSTVSSDWFAGASSLIIILPFILDSFFDGEIYEFSNIWQGFLFAVSFVLCTIPAFTFPFAPPESRFPHNGFWSELIFSDNFFVPNIGSNITNVPDYLTIVPCALLLVAAIYFVWRYSRRPNRFFIGAVAGLLIVNLYLFLPISENPQTKARRQNVTELIGK